MKVKTSGSTRQDDSHLSDSAGQFKTKHTNNKNKTKSV